MIRERPGTSPSKMYTLEDIYQRLDNNTQASDPDTGEFTEPSSGPTTGTGHTLNDVYAKAIPTQVQKTGQTQSYGTRDDGALQEGVSWPSPRWRCYDVSKATVDCDDGSRRDGNRSFDRPAMDDKCEPEWYEELDSGPFPTATVLTTGGIPIGACPTCPNWKAFGTCLIHLLCCPQVTRLLPFSQTIIGRVQRSRRVPLSKWYVHLADGFSGYVGETTDTLYVWPVRGGQ